MIDQITTPYCQNKGRMFMKIRSLHIGTLLFFIIGIQFVAGVAVSNPVINPTGDLTAGTNVSVSFKVNMTPAGNETFPKVNTLQIFTDLNNPKWVTTLIKDGVESPIPSGAGHSVFINGRILSYPSTVSESIRVTLEGSVPSVTKSMNKTIVLVQELDGNNAVIPASVFTRERLIVNPTDISRDIAVRESDLWNFRIHIFNKTQMGINTSAAEAKYQAAQSAILTAKNANFAEAQKALNNATILINDGEVLLEKAWAQQEIELAQVPINKTNELITYFTVNRSIKSDPRLAVIIAKKESAEQYLSSARDLSLLGNYAFSRVKAKEAFDKGNESLTEAINFKLDLTTADSGWGSWLNTTTLIIIAVVVALVAVAGYIYLRKKNRWENY
jgi:cellobiose-specific phosphotransferase system component IIA